MGVYSHSRPTNDVDDVGDAGCAHALVFCADARSEKMRDVARDARAEHFRTTLISSSSYLFFIFFFFCRSATSVIARS